ncbi:unnamed protein product [Ectocarpus fasciculatus]
MVTAVFGIRPPLDSAYRSPLTKRVTHGYAQGESSRVNESERQLAVVRTSQNATVEHTLPHDIQTLLGCPIGEIVRHRIQPPCLLCYCCVYTAVQNNTYA